MPKKKERPVFEVHEKGGNVFKIYADGTTEGFEDDVMIINRLPVRAAAPTDRATQNIADIVNRKG